MRQGSIALLLLMAAFGCRARAHAAGTSAHVLRIGDRTRTYLLHTPPGRAMVPRPLVVLLHGRLGDGAGMAKLTGFDALADREGIVVAYPDGVRRSWADGRMGTPADRENVDDVGFLLAMVTLLEKEEHVDPGQIFVAGMSNGGFMSERLACEASATFAAAGVVAATLGSDLAARCHPSRPVPIAYVNGTEDPLVPYAGGSLGGDRGTVLGAEESAARWRAWNGCTGTPTTTDLPQHEVDGTSVRLTRSSACRDGAEVLAYRVAGGGHAWPGGLQYLGEPLIGRTSRNLDASAALWHFFAAHRH